MENSLVESGAVLAWNYSGDPVANANVHNDFKCDGELIMQTSIDACSHGDFRNVRLQRYRRCGTVWTVRLPQ